MQTNLISAAVLVLPYISKGETFVFGDLVHPQIWQHLSVTDRMDLGMAFKKWISINGSGLLEKVDKTESGQQRYVKL